MDDKLRRVQALASRLKDWLDNGVPRPCDRPPWWRTLERIDADKILRLGRDKNIVDPRAE